MPWVDSASQHAGWLVLMCRFSAYASEMGPDSTGVDAGVRGQSWAYGVSGPMGYISGDLRVRQVTKLGDI